MAYNKELEKEIPKGWRAGKLESVINEIESGKRPKGGINSLECEIPSIGAENILGIGKYNYSKTKYVSKEFFNQMKVGKIRHNDVLLYKDGASLGRKSLFAHNFPFEDACINEHVFILRSNKKISSSFLFFWLDQKYMEKNIQDLNSNSAQPGINKTGVLSLPILIPNSTEIEKFTQNTAPILAKIFKNSIQIRVLTHIRDFLLPKLMSGQIRI